jgi:Fe2+ transport system protein FeoA
MLQLVHAPAGNYRIVKIVSPGVVRRMSNLGIFAGDTIEVIKPSPGPVIIKKGISRVGIGHGVAHRIFVIKTENNQQI